MSATIKSLPSPIAFSQEPMLVTLATNNVTSARARLDITLAHPSTGPEIDQIWTLGWAGKYIQFVFKGNPNNSGLQLPICDPTTGVTKRYLHELAEALLKHEWVSEQFEVIVSHQSYNISLQSRFDAPLSIISLSPVSNLTGVVTNAISPYLKPNLSAILKVVSRKGREIAKLSGSYIVSKGVLTNWEGLVTFDISSLFDLAPHLPETKTFNPTAIFTNGIAFRAYTKYFLRYADKYGTVPIAESLLRTQPAHVIYGGRALTTTTPFTPNPNGLYLCHRQITHTVTRHQPSYAYFFATKQINRIVVNVRLWMVDGIYIDFWAGTVHDIKADRLYYYRTGLEQLNIEAILNTFNVNSEGIARYEWQLIDELTRDIKISKNYILEPCRYDSIYLAYSNGLGGIETIHCKGGFTIKAEAERTIIQYTDPLSTRRPSVGALATTDATIQRTYEIQTGHIPLDYAEQLQQLLIGDVWLIDTPNQRFLKLIADTKSIEIRPQIGDFVALKMVFKTAWTDRNTV